MPLVIQSQGGSFVQFIFHKRHTCLSTLGEREKECPPDVNYCELRSPHHLFAPLFVFVSVFVLTPTNAPLMSTTVSWGLPIISLLSVTWLQVVGCQSETRTSTTTTVSTVVVLVLVMDHLQQDVDVPLHLVAEEQRDVEDHLIDPLHNCKL